MVHTVMARYSTKRLTSYYIKVSLAFIFRIERSFNIEKLGKSYLAFYFFVRPFFNCWGEWFFEISLEITIVKGQILYHSSSQEPRFRMVWYLLGPYLSVQKWFIAPTVRVLPFFTIKKKFPKIPLWEFRIPKTISGVFGHEKSTHEKSKSISPKKKS